MQYGVGESRRYADYAAYHHHIRLHCDPLTPSVFAPDYEQARGVGMYRAIECWLENIDGVSIGDPSDRRCFFQVRLGIPEITLNANFRETSQFHSGEDWY